MNRKAYRMIVLIVCLLALVANMLACDDGIDGVDSNGNLYGSSVETGQEYVHKINKSVSDVASDLAQGNNEQWMDSSCMSFFDQNCK